MELRARPAAPEDFPHLFRLAYGRSAGADKKSALEIDVQQEWDWLWSTGRFMTTLVMDVESDRVVALNGGILISERYYQSLVTSHEPYINKRLARTPCPGDRPLPSVKQLVDGSATLLFNYFSWDTSCGAENLAVLRGYLANAFLDIHGGYPIQRIAVEVRGRQTLELALKSGPSVVNDHADWARTNGVDDEGRMFLIAIDRAQALETENHWYTRAFRYQPPRLCFAPGQREMLLLARQGLTDRQIAQELNLTEVAIKKRWESIYGRFHERMPGVLAVNVTGRRGTEKRRLVLSHLHERLEELRP